MTYRRFPAAVAAVAAAAALVVGCSGKNAVDQTAGGQFRFTTGTSKGHLIAAGDRKAAADFTGSLLSGGTYRLDQQAGKVVVVNFWGSWCGPCRIETPQFNTVYHAYRGRDVTFVGIDVKEASRDAPRAFVKDFGIDYPIVYDEPSETALRLGDIPTQGMPFTVVLDKQHRVAGVYFGRLSPADLKPALNTLVAEK
jgi:thiol-disulfide isomerase/thioredoxin